MTVNVQSDGSSTRKLNRFTRYSCVLDMLRTRSIPFHDPQHWTDKNDARFLVLYKKHRQLETLRAVCFTSKGETVHDWNTFAKGEDGCCVEFDRDSLVKVVELLRPQGVFAGCVKHRTIEDLRQIVNSGDCDLEDLPFLKRYPFRCEAEYRVIGASADSDLSFEIRFEPEMIRKITLRAC